MFPVCCCTCRRNSFECAILSTVSNVPQVSSLLEFHLILARPFVLTLRVLVPRAGNFEQHRMRARPLCCSFRPLCGLGPERPLLVSPLIHSLRKRAVARLHKGFELGWTAPRSRDELHER